MEIRCLIVDDDVIASTSLNHLCGKMGDLQVVQTCTNADEALSILEDETVNLVFLDIEMPGVNGMDLVKSINYLPYVIFTTSRPEYAAEAFEYKDRIIDFITKPVTLSRLSKAMERVREALAKAEQTEAAQDIFVRSEGRIVRIHVKDLLFIETIGDYVIFQTLSGKHIVHSTLKRVDEKLKHPDLLKVHRSFIINLSKVIDIEDNTILIDKKVIPVSRQYKPLLLKKINPL